MLVLDLSYTNFSGIIAGTFFGEAGAEVIRIEPPQGDPARVMSPYGVNQDGVGTNYLMESRNKRHITLDLETESGRQNLKALASKADVLIETYAPGKMNEIGLGYRQLRELNPALVYVAITPYGPYGGKSGDPPKRGTGSFAACAPNQSPSSAQEKKGPISTAGKIRPYLLCVKNITSRRPGMVIYGHWSNMTILTT